MLFAWERFRVFTERFQWRNGHHNRDYSVNRAERRRRK